MEVPLLQRRNQAFLTQYPQRGVFSTTAQAAALPQIPSLKDAVRISISQEAKDKAAAAGGANADSSSTINMTKGYGEQALERLYDLSGQMKGVMERLSNEVGSSNKEALQAELESMKQEFQSIIQSPELKRFMELTSLVKGTLAAGTSPDVLERSIRGEAGLLGDRFINTVKGGGGTLGIVEGALGSILSTSLESLELGDTSVLNRIRSDVKSINEALSGPIVSTQTIAAPVIEVSTPEPIIINPDETQYAVGSNLALSVKNFGGKNLIAMAVGVEGLDANDLFELEIKAPEKDDDEEEKKKKEEETNPLK